MTSYSYQLYSSRNFPPLQDTLGMLSRIGYTAVEGYGAMYDDPAAVRAALDKAGLRMTSAHFSLDALEDHFARSMDVAGVLDISSIYAPHLQAENRPRDAGGWKDFGRRLGEIGARLNHAGHHFGWHNHDFEFVPLSDGSVPMSHILSGAPEIGWEADIAWIVRGGADPLEWIADYKDRITAVHIKDIAPPGECADEDGWADVGYGTMDWKALMQALGGAPVRHFVMEHDKPNDHERFARRSFQTMSAL